MPKKTTRKKKGPEPLSLGLAPHEATADPPAEIQKLVAAVEADGGAALAAYRDPLGGHWQILASLPIERVHPTPFQRDLSDTHVKRLSQAVEKLGRFLDPIIAVRRDDGTYWTSNGNHRRAAIAGLGGKSITALVVPDPGMAYEILALNTEKAHNVREKSLEVIRMARDLAELDPLPESQYGHLFEEPSFLTLGACYEQKGRFAGSAYQPVLKRVESFLDVELPAAIETREGRAQALFELDAAVAAAVAALKERGFDSPYLKNFVVARVNPLRFKKDVDAEFDPTIENMTRAAADLDVTKVKVDQVAKAAGAAGE
ncbi:MAG: ParB/RepB/Spo0J family partition protein [Planctomycetota bacterium]